MTLYFFEMISNNSVHCHIKAVANSDDDARKVCQDMIDRWNKGHVGTDYKLGKLISTHHVDEAAMVVDLDHGVIRPDAPRNLVKYFSDSDFHQKLDLHTTLVHQWSKTGRTER